MRKNTEEGPLGTHDGNAVTLTAGLSMLHFMKSSLCGSRKGFSAVFVFGKNVLKILVSEEDIKPWLSQGVGCVWEGGLHPVGVTNDNFHQKNAKSNSQ